VEPPKGLFLDFDDTLLDGSVIPVAVERTCEELARSTDPVGAPDLLRANGEAFRGYWPEAEPRCARGEIDLLDVSRELWRRTLSACGLDDPALVVVAFETHQRIAGELARVFDDVPVLLAALRDAGIATALVTNSSVAGQMEKLASVQLASAFDAVVVSGELGAAKPDPAIFREALRRLGLTNVEVWHVGDSLSSDVAGASAAGIRSVWLNRNGRRLGPTDPIPDAEITSLHELVALIAGA
jgi:putative hydrolase of the HAD superfamily